MLAMTAAPSFTVEPTATPTSDERRQQMLAAPGFGRYFSDHMFTGTWTPDDGWHDGRVHAYGPITLDPATAVLHYAQEIFEGMKAYARPDGSIWTFRPDANAARFRQSARRMALPEMPTEWFVEAVDETIRIDRAWVPSGGETSLYVRPFMFASEVFLGVRPSRRVTFCIITSPAGAYFAKGVSPVSIWLSTDYNRAGAGGTGAAKCGGNYAASLLPQREAAEQGCDQVAFLDSVEQTWVEELGGMNLFFVSDDGSIVTPELSGSILEGITRSSILTLAGDLGHKVEERRVSIDEWRDGVASGSIAEVFACGTAAVVTPLGTLKWKGGQVGTGEHAGPVTLSIRDRLLDLQYGRAEDPYHWMHRVV